MAERDYRRLSLWHDTYPGSLARRPPLPGDQQVDVAVVGGGYTGLWTAYYLKQADPGLRIAIMERETAGFGASGRNGGWCSAIFPASLRKVASHSSRQDAARMQQAMNDTVDEVGRVAAAENIDCGFAKGGYVSLARNQAQLLRARAEVAQWQAWGFGEEQLRLLGKDEATAMCGAANVSGGTFTPHCAALNPTALVRGLAGAVERMGVAIYEGSPVTQLRPRLVRTPHGRVSADVVVRATEGYTAQLPGLRRAMVPMYSLMVATEPLPETFWREAGLARRPTFSDKRHLRIYGQRTADGRIAFGGRGAPYHFGSRVKPRFDRDRRVHDMLERILVDLFPALKGVAVTHRWGGNLGIPRDWYPHVAYHPGTGMAVSGGYVGDGVATANLGGRTLAEMITGRRTELVKLPWAQSASPGWEPEPLRWLGVNAGTAIFALGDRNEARSGRPSRLPAAFWRLLGH
ncbi:MAG: FAD-binding oxidoreductase [Nocardiopsaceae bacterium]|nr:FAD-binding oxidoreductase [Nocardiopsaceae bacterium]